MSGRVYMGVGRGRHTGRDGDDSFGDFLTEERLRRLLHLPEDHSGDFFWGLDDIDYGER